MSQDFRTFKMESMFLVGRPTHPVSLPGVVTMKRYAEKFVLVVRSN